MPVTNFARPRRSTAVRAAIVGATRALEAAYPVRLNQDLPHRMAEALAALVQAEAVSILEPVEVIWPPVTRQPSPLGQPSAR